MTKGLMQLKITILLSVIFLSLNLYSKELNVLFLNPGSKNDIGVWYMVSKFMKAAAEDLDINLEIIYADRNHIKMIDQAKEIAKRKRIPDYVIMVNEKMAGKEMLRAFTNSSAKILFIHNGLTDKQRKTVGNERDKFPNWIGTITTHEYLSGYMLMSELLKLKPGNPKILGINGDKVTPVSTLRLTGIIDCLSAHGRGQQIQVVNGDWSMKDGNLKTSALLKRYKDIDIIWAANDSMAIGASNAVKNLKLENKILIGGMGGFPDALKSIKDKEMKLTIGGHPMIGGWALVLIYDYNASIDFKHDIGLKYNVNDLLSINNAKKADIYSKIVLENPSQIDFTEFSKKLNVDLTEYDFSFHKVIQAAGLADK